MSLLMMISISFSCVFLSLYLSFNLIFFFQISCNCTFRFYFHIVLFFALHSISFATSQTKLIFCVGHFVYSSGLPWISFHFLFLQHRQNFTGLRNYGRIIDYYIHYKEIGPSTQPCGTTLIPLENYDVFHLILFAVFCLYVSLLSNCR